MWDCNTKLLSQILNNCIFIFMLGNSTVWHLRISYPPSSLNPDTFIGPLNVTWITVSHSSEHTEWSVLPRFRNADWLYWGESLGETWTLWAASYRHNKRQQSHLYTTRMLAATSTEYRKAQKKWGWATLRRIICHKFLIKLCLAEDKNKTKYRKYYAITFRQFI